MIASFAGRIKLWIKGMTDYEESFPFLRRFKNIFIGRAKTIQDKSIFHKLSLVAFFAWIGLGADGISSSCYGPEEAYRNLQGHTMLAIFVALGTVFHHLHHQLQLQPDHQALPAGRRRISGWKQTSFTHSRDDFRMCTHHRLCFNHYDFSLQRFRCPF